MEISYDFDGFVARIFSAVQHSLKNRDKEKRFWEGGELSPVKKASEVTHETELHGKEVCIGGTEGGGYGEGQTPHPYINHNPGPVELLELDEVLEILWPTITYLQYKALVREAEVKTESRSETEYYGNTSNYVYMKVTLGALYDAIVTVAEKV